MSRRSMNSLRSGALFALVSLLPAWASNAQDASLANRLARFSERVEAVYSSHRGSPARRSDAGRAEGRSRITEAGRRRLDEASFKSAALEHLFGIVISPVMLQAELDRMGRETAQPERLKELLDALDEDPAAAAEVLARPLLADRLLRRAYASDRALHAKARAQVLDALSAIRSGGDWPVGLGRLSVCALDEACVRRAEEGPMFDGEGRRVLSEKEWAAASRRWPEPGAPPRLEEEDDAFAVLRARRDSSGRTLLEAFSVAKRPFDEWWSEARPAFLHERPRESAAAYRLPGISDVSPCGTLAPLVGQPAPRQGASAVWTGSEMIFFGGQSSAMDGRGSGGRYSPATNSYRRLPAGPGYFPQAYDTVATWTGSQLVVFLPGYWGNEPLEGAAYDATSDSWTSISQGSGCPPGLRNLATVWSGQEVLVWGTTYDSLGHILGVGARWNPTTNTWRSMSTEGAPTPRSGFACVWTGDEMIIFGGTSLQGGDPAYLTGARYSPRTDTWRRTSVQAATPACQAGFSAVWTGSEMIVWGGSTDQVEYVNSGGRYNPATDSWTATSSTGAPDGRSGHSAVWTGAKMIVWGGANRRPTNTSNETTLDTGGWYDPSTDSWAPIPIDRFCPVGRKDHVALWTGEGMLVWSGYTFSADGYGARLGDGGLLKEDGWHPILMGTANTERLQYMQAVWTGAEFIVWGGEDWWYKHLNTGAVYDSPTGSWRPTAVDWNTPTARYAFSSVWSGSEMVVWGGLEIQPFPYQDAPVWTGGRYDPALDRWETTNPGPGTPLPRYSHSAVWAGDRMIIWGGIGDWYSFLNTGGLYDPVLDRWTAMTADSGCPSPRSGASLVWTGSEMILFGGGAVDSAGQQTWLADGARYSPATGHWTALPTAGAPGARTGCAGVWTGDMAIFWGGTEPSSPTLGTGGRFSPATGAWSPITASGACPLARSFPPSIWTGTRMLIWGGGVWQAPNASGSFYDPDADLWEEAPDATGFTSYGNSTYVAGGGNPVFYFNGGESAGYVITPCFSARALASPDPTAGALAARFQGFASGGREPYAYDWDFGDGSAHGSGAIASHTYASGGVHTFRLTVTDASGEGVGQSKSFEFLPPPAMTSVKALANPFRLQIDGSGFLSGTRVDINGTQPPTTQFVSSAQLSVGGGKALKALVPKGRTVTVRVTNPDGRQTTLPFTR
jgi:N-acetylneuraminic acid mutarotase